MSAFRKNKRVPRQRYSPRKSVTMFESQVWWHMTAISVSGRQQWKDQEFELAWAALVKQQPSCIDKAATNFYEFIMNYLRS